MKGGMLYDMMQIVHRWERRALIIMSNICSSVSSFFFYNCAMRCYTTSPFPPQVIWRNLHHNFQSRSQLPAFTGGPIYTGIPVLLFTSKATSGGECMLSCRFCSSTLRTGMKCRTSISCYREFVPPADSRELQHLVIVLTPSSSERKGKICCFWPLINSQRLPIPRLSWDAHEALDRCMSRWG
jgi:hypothetical protein